MIRIQNNHNFIFLCPQSTAPFVNESRKRFTISHTLSAFTQPFKNYSSRIYTAIFVPLGEVEHSGNSGALYAVVNLMIVWLWCCASKIERDNHPVSSGYFIRYEFPFVCTRCPFAHLWTHAVLCAYMRLIVSCWWVFGCSNYEEVNVSHFVCFIPSWTRRHHWHWQCSSLAPTEWMKTVKWFNFKIENVEKHRENNETVSCSSLTRAGATIANATLLSPGILFWIHNYNLSG